MKMKQNNELKDAVNILIKHLNNDSAYRYAWQANIAMAIKDSYDPKDPDVHYFANNAAIRFLQNLTMNTDVSEDVHEPTE